MMLSHFKDPKGPILTFVIGANISETVLAMTNVCMKHIMKLDDSAFFRAQSYITELCYIKFLSNLLIRWFMSL